MIHVFRSRSTAALASLFIFLSFPAYSGVWVELKNHEKMELQKVEDPSVNLQGDLTLGLDALESAFNEASETELKDHFGESKDMRTFYSKLIEEDDIIPFRQKQITWIRAVLNNNLVGWMTLSPNFRESGTVYVSTLVVSPHKKNLGIGQKLLKSIAENWFPETNELNLVVRKINHRAIRFYKKLGFVEAPDIDSPFVGNPLHCFFMRLVLQKMH